MAWQYRNLANSHPPVAFQTAEPVRTATPAQLFPRPMVVEDSTVRLVNGKAIAPAHAPLVVKRAVAAGNRLQRYPYRFGGGHAVLNDTAYDCSGAVSYVLREAGLLEGQMPSRGFLKYGRRGAGEWITIWARNGHVYMTIGGLRLDTGGTRRGDGPRWKSKTRDPKGFSPRHPSGL